MTTVSVPGGSGGGGAFRFRTPVDIFTGTTLALARTARDHTTSGITGTALARFDSDPGLFIILRVGVDDTYEHRVGSAWVVDANAIKGEKGDQGDEGVGGILYLQGFANSTSVPATPTGGTYDIETGAFVLPAGLTELPSSPAAGETTYEFVARVDPIVESGVVDLTWSSAVPANSLGVAAAAQSAASALASAASATASETNASASETLAAADRAAASASRTGSETAETNAETAQAAAEAAAASAQSTTGHAAFLRQTLSSGTQTGIAAELTNLNEFNLIVDAMTGGAGVLRRVALPAISEDIGDSVLVGIGPLADPPSAIYYKRAHHAHEVVMRADDVSSRSRFASATATGYSSVNHGSRYGTGGALFPQVPAGLQVFLQQLDNAEGAWRYIFQESTLLPTDPATVWVEVRRISDGTTAARVELNRQTDGRYTSSYFSAAMIHPHERWAFSFWNAATGGTAYDLFTDLISWVRIADADSIQNVEAFARSIVENLSLTGLVDTLDAVPVGGIIRPLVYDPVQRLFDLAQPEAAQLHFTYASARDAFESFATGFQVEGNIYRADVDISVLAARVSYAIPGPASNDVNVTAWLVPLTRNNFSSYRRSGTPVQMYVNGHESPGVLAPAPGFTVEDDWELTFNDRTHYNISAGQHFAIVVQAIIGPRPRLVGDTSDDEAAHTGSHAISYDPITRVAYSGFDERGAFTTSTQFYGNADGNVQMEIDYNTSVTGALLVKKEGVNEYVGQPVLDFRGTGVEVSEETDDDNHPIARVTIEGLGSEELLNEWQADPPDVAVGVTGSELLANGSDVAVTLASGQTIAVGDFLQIDDEVLRVTVIIGMGSYTVTRGVFGTDGLVSHAINTAVTKLPRAEGRTIAPLTWVYDVVTNNNIFDMGRPLLPADDNKDIKLEFRYYSLASGVRLLETKSEGVFAYRRALEHPLTGQSLHEALSEYIPRQNIGALNTFGALNFAIGHRTLTAQDETDGLGTEGNSALVIGLGSSEPGSLIRFEMRITLTGGGGTVSAPAIPEEQSIAVLSGSLYFATFYFQGPDAPSFAIFPQLGATGVPFWNASQLPTGVSLTRTFAVDPSSSDAVWVIQVQGSIEGDGSVFQASPTITQEFGVRYSDDSGATFQTSLPTGSLIGWEISFLLPGGQRTGYYPIGPVQSPWTQLWQGAWYQDSTQSSNFNQKLMTLNMASVSELWVRVIVFGGFGVSGILQSSIGATLDAYVKKPQEGVWPMVASPSAAYTNGTYLWTADEITGLAINHLDSGSYAIGYAPILPAYSQRPGDRPYRKMSGYITMGGPSHDNLTSMNMWGSQRAYARAHWDIRYRSEEGL